MDDLGGYVVTDELTDFDNNHEDRDMAVSSSVDRDRYTDGQACEDCEEITETQHETYEQNVATAVHIEEQRSDEYTDTYLLPAKRYDPHATKDVSNQDHRPERAQGRYHRVSSCIREREGASRTIEPNGDLLLNWLRSEVMDGPENLVLERESDVLMDSRMLAQHMDDPYDTSASSCARTSHGTLRQYITGADRLPVDRYRLPQNDAVNSLPKCVPPTETLTSNQIPRLSHPRPYSWPLVPAVHAVRPSSTRHLVGIPPIPKKKLAGTLKCSMLKGSQAIFERIFTKRGIDGRTLQRRKPAIFQKISMLSRKQPRAERQADALRNKVLRQRNASHGFYQVLAANASYSTQTVEAGTSNSTDIRG